MDFLVIAQADEHGSVSIPSLECVEELRGLAGGANRLVRVLLPGYGLEGQVTTLAAHGADEVTLVEHPALAHAGAEAWLAALEPVVQARVQTARDGLLLLAPATSSVQAWLPRLALRLGAPLVSNCLEVRSDDEAGMLFVRPTHSGACHEQLSCPEAPVVCASLTAGVRGIGRGDPRRRAQLGHVRPALEGLRFRDRPLRTLPPDPRTVDLPEAERIVAGGLGVGGPEGVELLWELAATLEAAVGGTRVIADRGWLPPERFIGTTGKIVAPKLYLALGISGASQHTSGMLASETVIVVNSDRTAPMFGLADLGIVGDLHAFAAALLVRLAAQRVRPPVQEFQQRSFAA